MSQASVLSRIVPGEPCWPPHQPPQFFSVHANFDDTRGVKACLAPLRKIECQKAVRQDTVPAGLSFAHRVAISNRRLISADHSGIGLRGAANRGTAQRLLGPRSGSKCHDAVTANSLSHRPASFRPESDRSAHPRDFVPWRFSDADLSSARIVSPSSA